MTVAEEEHCSAWLRLRWKGWYLPELFVQVNGAIGCRLLKLHTARTADLKDDRLHLESESRKGRKDRQPKLPAYLFGEVKELAGPVYL